LVQTCNRTPAPNRIKHTTVQTNMKGSLALATL
jgi:hypothetical protein